MNYDLKIIKTRHAELMRQWDANDTSDTDLESAVVIHDMPLLFEAITELYHALLAMLEPAGDTPEEVRQQALTAVNKWSERAWST